MAEINTAVIPEVSENPDVTVQVENNISSVQDIGSDIPLTQPQVDEQKFTVDEVIVPSNVIDGIFKNKEVTENEVTEKLPDLEKQTADPENTKQEEVSVNKKRGRPPKDKDDKAPETANAEKLKRGKPPKDKAEKAPGEDKPQKVEHAPRLPKAPKADKQAAVAGGSVISGSSATAQEVPAAEPEVTAPKDATRPGIKETVVYITHAELHPFKHHPFQIRDDEAMKSLVESVKDRGIDQPALVRPREDGGYELVAGHRRQHAAELAGYTNIPCIVRNMTDDEAILAMTESNFNQRAEILPSERAQALKMQLDAIKRQGARSEGIANGDVGKRSNEVIAERNKMSIKNVQRYIAYIPENRNYVF